MGARYKNGVPVPITRWEGSWAAQQQMEREAKKELGKQQREERQQNENHPKRR